MAKRIPFTVVRTHPHARDAFTQGLVWDRGQLLESTGNFGESSIRRVELETGQVLHRETFGDHLFAEGLARVADELFLITWRNQTAFVFDAGTFKVRRVHGYLGEGWGLTFDGSELWMSDGTRVLQRRAPNDFRELGRVSVAGGRMQLNALCAVGPLLYANDFETDRILVIDPRAGALLGELDCSALLSAAERARASILNGIAHDPVRNRLLVTGKYWPTVFELEVGPVG